MLRVTNHLKSVMNEGFKSNLWSYQSVRWGRKPRWLPTAKSKLFKISQRVRLPEDEGKELLRLYNSYRTQLKSLRQYFKERYSVENLVAFDEEQHRKAVEDDFARCSAINDQWNSELKITREIRTQKELDENIAFAKNRLQEKLESQARALQEAEQIVRREKEASKDFITPDKLDAAIEYAINNPVDYNYALDLKGNKIWGRETKPPVEEKLKLKNSVSQ